MSKRPAHRRAVLRQEWKALWPQRPHRWWAEVAVMVKELRVRSGDTAKLKAVMAGVDNLHPRLRNEGNGR